MLTMQRFEGCTSTTLDISHLKKDLNQLKTTLLAEYTIRQVQ